MYVYGKYQAGTTKNIEKEISSKKMKRYNLTLALSPETVFNVITTEEANELKVGRATSTCTGYDGQHYVAMGAYKKEESRKLIIMQIFLHLSYPLKKQIDIGYLPENCEEFMNFLGVTPNEINNFTFSKPLKILVETEELFDEQDMCYTMKLYKGEKTYIFNRRR